MNETTLRLAMAARERHGERRALHPSDLGVVSFGPAVSAYFEYHAVAGNEVLNVVDWSSASEAILQERIADVLCVSIADDALEWIRFTQRRNERIIDALRKDPAFELAYKRDIYRNEGDRLGSYYLFCRP